MHDTTANPMLTELGKRLVERIAQRRGDSAGNRGDAQLRNSAVGKCGEDRRPEHHGSRPQRGRPGGRRDRRQPRRHKMILGTGAGTRARHVYSLAIDLGLPVGVLTVLGTAVAWQNAQMLQYLLAQHGIAFLEPEGFASLPHYLMERGAVICQGMPPYKLWEANPERRAHSAAAHRHRLLPDRRGVRRPQDDLRQGRGRALHRRPEEGPARDAYPAHQRAGTAGARSQRSGGRARGARADAATRATSARSSSSTG